MIDLDANATTRLLPEVVDAMLPWLRDHHANPNGAYAAAKRSREAIEQARAQVAGLIGANPEEIVFTSGGTESVNAALHSLHTLTAKGDALVSAIEHSAVLRCVDALPREVQALPVDELGRIQLDALKQAVKDAAFISLMAANNEVGVIQPLQEAITIARDAGIPIHSDATQVVGKIHFSVAEHALDLLSLSAHKFHGPKGVGALYIRRGLEFDPMIRGGGQESGRRSGTENTASIVGMGVAAEAAMNELSNGLSERLAKLRDGFEHKIMDGLEGVHRNGSPAPLPNGSSPTPLPNGCPDTRLPNTSHLSFEGCEAEGLIILLDEAGVQCSAGSACMTGKQQPSHVQLAMGIDEVTAKSSLRFSFSRFNTEQEIDPAAQAVIAAVKKLRGIQGSGTGPVVIYSP